MIVFNCLCNPPSGRHPSCIDTSQVFGFILNVPSEYKIGFVSLPLRRRHWIALRCINDVYWNLDSKLDAPKAIGMDANLVRFLGVELASKEKELFIIVRSGDIEQQQKWLRSGPDADTTATKS